MQLQPIFYVFRNVYKPRKKEEPLYQEVIDAAFNISCKMFTVTKTAIKSRSRKHEITVPRQVAATLIYKYSGLTLKSIGLEMGGRDHTTIIHAKGVVSDLYLWDKLFKEKYDACDLYMASMFRAKINKFKHQNKKS